MYDHRLLDHSISLLIAYEPPHPIAHIAPPTAVLTEQKITSDSHGLSCRRGPNSTAAKHRVMHTLIHRHHDRPHSMETMHALLSSVGKGE